MASYPPPMDQPRQGMPTWAKVLIALVVVGVVIIGAIAGAGYYFFRKIADEPGGPLAAMVRFTNPDYEVIDVNEKSETITVKHKRTGKTGTIRMDKLRKGGIDPKDLGMTNEEAGVLAPPPWFAYPGSTVQSTAGDARNIQMTLITEDEPSKIVEYYEGQLKANGFQVSSVPLTRMIIGTSKDGKSAITVLLAPGKQGQQTVRLALKQ